MSITNFENFNISIEIIKSLRNLNYITPTEVQEKVIPRALEKRDLIVKSQTGSGKTAAFGIPICEMVEWEENKPQVLVLTPTRELAAQVMEDVTNIGRYKRVNVLALYGKQSFMKQKLELNQKVHVVVGTPGRVLDHVEKGTFYVEQLKYLIIDEADEMLNMGFIDQVKSIIEKIPKDRVTFVFSATLPEDVVNLCHEYMNNPLHIEIKGKGITTNTITHFLIEVAENEKFSLLKDVTAVENPDSCIIFCNTQEKVDVVFRYLRRSDYPCEKIHGGMVQEERFKVMNEFKRGKFRYLVATNVAARGIDIENISHVINFDFPLEKESYVHRTGRTGRAGQKGRAISFITSSEKKFLEEIEEFIGFSIRKYDRPSLEKVTKSKHAFLEKLTIRPSMKAEKAEIFNKEIMKLYFNGGKKKKLRAIDFVGTISNIPGISSKDIGIISIQENATFVDILNGKGPLVLKTMKNTTIKGKLLKVHCARK